ncbi:MAG: beta-propeller domain-containing protein [Acholeplasmataceae bacterium]
MTVLKWIIIIVFSILAILYVTKLTLDLLWHKRLNQFKINIGEALEKFPKALLIKNTYVSVFSVFVILSVFMISNYQNITIADKTYVQAKTVSSYDTLHNLISNYDAYNIGWLPEYNSDLTSTMDDGIETQRSYTDTNVQVSGVDEADVIKTDGYQIYFVPKYDNVLYVFDIDDQGDIALVKTIDLENYYVEGMFLTDTQVILIGYTYQFDPYQYNTFDVGWYYVNDTASIQIYNRESLDLVYDLYTDTHFYQYRLIDDMLYLLSQKYIYSIDEDYRPVYDITLNNESYTTYLSYDQIYYFEDSLTNSMSVITTINLNDYTMDAQAFMISLSLIYANTNAFYAISYVSNYDDINSEWVYYTKVLKFRFDDLKALKYVASGTIEGYVENQYWMDEYEDYFRVVTTDWSAINRLYVLSEDPEIDQLNLVSLIDEDLGLENERVKSVRFNGNIAQIVTFETHDPLYTIDLSDPLNPIIEDNPIEDDGFSTYLHVWQEDYQLVGFGFDANDMGIVTGLKLSAYDTNLSVALDEYTFNTQDDEYVYSYSEAIYNPRALLINVEKGLFGFPVTGFHYNQNNSSYYYQTCYYLFKIDYTKEDILGIPIIIEHDVTSYYNQVYRGVEIDDKLYTFSRDQVVVLDINSGENIQNYHYVIN